MVKQQKNIKKVKFLLSFILAIFLLSFSGKVVNAHPLDVPAPPLPEAHINLIDSFSLVPGKDSKVDIIFPHEVMITPNEFNKSGAIWNKRKLDLKYDFDFETAVFLGNDVVGADGMAIVLHNDPRGILSIGSKGYGLGVSSSDLGNEFIENALAIAIRGGRITLGSRPMSISLFKPEGTRIRPSQDAPNVLHFDSTTDESYMKQWRRLSVKWNAEKSELSYKYGDRDEVVQEIDVEKEFGTDQVYWGFTGGTGSLRNYYAIAVLRLPQDASGSLTNKVKNITRKDETFKEKTLANVGDVLEYQYILNNPSASIVDFIDPVLSNKLVKKTYVENSLKVDDVPLPDPSIEDDTFKVSMNDVLIDRKGSVNFQTKLTGFDNSINENEGTVLSTFTSQISSNKTVVYHGPNLEISHKLTKEKAKVGEKIRYTVEMKNGANSGKWTGSLLNELPKGVSYIPNSTEVSTNGGKNVSVKDVDYWQNGKMISPKVTLEDNSSFNVSFDLLVGSEIKGKIVKLASQYEGEGLGEIAVDGATNSINLAIQTAIQLSFVDENKQLLDKKLIISTNPAVHNTNPITFDFATDENYNLVDIVEGVAKKLKKKYQQGAINGGELQGKVPAEGLEIEVVFEPKKKAEFNYQVERNTKNLTLKNIVIDPTVDKDYQTLDIIIPKHIELKSVTVPKGWVTYSSDTSNTYVMGDNNSIATIKEFLTSLQFTITSKEEQKVAVTVNLNKNAIVPREHEDGTTHYYKFVPGNENWYEAYNLAKEQKYKGLTGYLMTVTSKSENDFIKESLSIKPGWLGGTRQTLLNGKKITDESKISEKYDDYQHDGAMWYWATGPEGMKGSKEKDFNASKTGHNAVDNMHIQWASGEPNNSIGFYSPTRPEEPTGTEEDSLQWGKSGSTNWNDLSALYRNNVKWIDGYYVEFSEYDGQKENQESDTDDMLSFNGKVPQYVKFTAFDLENKPLPKGDLILNQDLLIGKNYDLSSKIKLLPGYSFLETQEASLTGEIRDELISGKLIYEKSYLTLEVKFVDKDDVEIKKAINIDVSPKQIVNLTENEEVTNRRDEIIKEGYTLVKSPEKEKAIEIEDNSIIVSYEFQGELSFIGAPDKIEFEQGKKVKNAQQLSYTGENKAGLRIRDNREKNIRGNFSVDAKISTELINANNNKLTNSYIELPILNKNITTEANTLWTNNTPSADSFYDILLDEGKASSKDKHMKLVVPTMPEIGEYKGIITWTVIPEP